MIDIYICSESYMLTQLAESREISLIYEDKLAGALDRLRSIDIEHLPMRKLVLSR